MMRGLAKRYGLTMRDVLLAQAPGSEETIYSATRLSRGKALRRFPAGLQDARGASRGLRHRDDVRPFDGRGPHLRQDEPDRIDQRYVPGGLRSDVGKYILFQYVAEYGIDPGLQSSLNMIYWLGRQPDYDASTGEFNALGPSDEHFHIAGGNQQLPVAIAKSARRKHPLSLGAPRDRAARGRSHRFDLRYAGRDARRDRR